MRQERELGAGRTGDERGGASEPLGPGKATLTGAMSGLAVQRKPANGRGAAAPTGPGKATLTGAMSAPGVQRRARDRSRDIDADAHDGGEHDAGEHDAGPPPPDTRIANPAPGGGAHVAATVVGSSADTELAGDGAFTPALLADLEANPQLSIDEVLQRVTSAAVPVSPYARAVQHPTIMQMGRMPRAGAGNGSRGGKKRAVLVANEDYVHEPELFTPLKEAQAMKSELATRGYESGVHHNKSAAEMGALWNTLVGAANPGDDLVAFYGGHGEPAGLAGINHGRPPVPPDLFHNAQVSSVVSSATDKGAHIRFVLDSCYSGAAVDTVREERHNELAAATGAGSVGDELRLATMTGLRHTKQRLLAISGAARALGRLRAARPQPDAHAPDGHAPTRDFGARDVVPASGPVNSAADRAWSDCAPLIEMAHMIVRHAAAPPPADPTSLAARLNYLDDLWNALQQPIEDALAKSADARKAP